MILPFHFQVIFRFHVSFQVCTIHLGIIYFNPIPDHPCMVYLPAFGDCLTVIFPLSFYGDGTPSYQGFHRCHFRRASDPADCPDAADAAEVGRVCATPPPVGLAEGVSCATKSGMNLIETPGNPPSQWTTSLVVEPTPLKNTLVKMGSSSPIFEVEIPKKLELPPPRQNIQYTSRPPMLRAV